MWQWEKVELVSHSMYEKQVAGWTRKGVQKERERECNQQLAIYASHEVNLLSLNCTTFKATRWHVTKNTWQWLYSLSIFIVWTFHIHFTFFSLTQCVSSMATFILRSIRISSMSTFRPWPLLISFRNCYCFIKKTIWLVLYFNTWFDHHFTVVNIITRSWNRKKDVHTATNIKHSLFTTDWYNLRCYKLCI